MESYATSSLEWVSGTRVILREKALFEGTRLVFLVHPEPGPHKK
jgi:hypothetical protein